MKAVSLSHERIGKLYLKGTNQCASKENSEYTYLCIRNARAFYNHLCSTISEACSPQY